MKSILISIHPEFVAKILNGEKTLEIRKTCPKCNLPIDVYIYCTDPNAKEVLSLFTKEAREHQGRVVEFIERKRVDNPNMRWSICNSRVVAKFRLKKAEKFIQGLNEAEYERLPNFALKDYDYYGLEDLMEKACLNDEEINKYAQDLSFYAWHISDLVIFDEPMELSEFRHEKKFRGCSKCKHISPDSPTGGCNMDCYGVFKITKAPQSWCYVEEIE